MPREYSVHRIGGTVRWLLTDEDITREAPERKPRKIRLRDVRHVQLARLRGVFLCRLRTGKGREVEVECRTAQDSASSYVRFLDALHLALAREAPDARFVRGSRLILGLGVATSLAGAALLVASVAAGSTDLEYLLYALGMAGSGIAAIVVGRPKSYRPDAIPVDILPVIEGAK